MSDHPSPHPSHPAYQAQPGYLPAPGRPAESHRALRLLALTAVGLGVLVLAAAAFLLSYPGIHAVALQAGVSRPLARVYPVIFDAMLVIACAAVLALRGAGLVSRVYAWLSLLVLLAAAAGADSLHSTGIKPPHRDAAAVAAILPWALVLIGFALLLAMLRHARLHRAAAAAARQQPVASEQPVPYRPAPPPVAALPAGSTPPAGNSWPGPALPAGTDQPSRPEVAVAAPGPLQVPRQTFREPAADTAAPAAAQADHAVPGHAVLEHVTPDHVTPEHGVREQAAPEHAVPVPTAPVPRAPEYALPGHAVLEHAVLEHAVPGQAAPEHAAPELAAPVPADAELDDPRLGTPPAQAGDRPDDRPGADAPPPAFHRMWSSPTPPGEDDEL